MNYLGLDYGQKHLGIALASGPLAEPLTTVSTETSIQLIKSLVQKHHIANIIIGRPSESLKLEFEKFINLLRIENYKLKIVDETLSSHDARTSLLHTTQSRRKSGEHSAAAALILQSYLDNIHSYA